MLVATVDRVEGTTEKQCHASLCDQPTVKDLNLKIKLIYQGEFKFNPDNISPVSSMTFLGRDILILDKNNGTVYRIANGSILDGPLLDVNVANKRERGLLGIATSRDNHSTKSVFLYYTESRKFDGSDVSQDILLQARNRANRESTL